MNSRAELQGKGVVLSLLVALSLSLSVSLFFSPREPRTREVSSCYLISLSPPRIQSLSLSFSRSRLAHQHAIIELRPEVPLLTRSRDSESLAEKERQE